MKTYILDARTANNHFPGIGRYTANLVQALIPLLNNHERLILLYDPTQPSAWDLKTLTSTHVSISDVRVSPFSLRQQWVIPSLLRQLDGDLYHSPYYLMPYRTDLPTVLTVYDFIPTRYPQYVSPQARLFFYWTMKLALRATNKIIVISDATLKDLAAIYHLPANQITTIPLAADPAFKPQPKDKIKALRTQLDLPSKYILYVGINKPHKNLVRLVDAWAKLQPEPFKLLIAGYWDERYPEVKERVKALSLSDSIRFLNNVDEKVLPTLYSGATAFVFPSEYEGFGMPVLEAMRSGTPVACADSSSLPEIVGNSAVCFNPTDVNAITNALRCLIRNENLRASLREQGFQQAAKFSWQKTAQATLDLYRSVL